MPRPVKFRRVCSLPSHARFGPLGGARAERLVYMTIDEYEAIRLIDREGFTQEECAGQMGVARSTVQGIYDGARKKIAECLVDGKTLVIEGGRYILCEGLEKTCGCGGCNRHRRGRKN
jgi:predicted DNA-binding protein (UPF0251 family)